MHTILAVAEKPSVAKSLAEIIGRGQQVNIRNGFSPYNKIFEVNTTVGDQPCRMIITSVLGHMMDLKIEDRYSGSWASTNPINLFDCHVYKEFKKDAEPLKRTLQQEARKCNALMLWLDCDVEGENISYEVIQCCMEANPRLQNNILRAKFSALNDRDIQRALRYPAQPNPQMNDAVDARQEIDLRLGAAFTRFQTLRLKTLLAGELGAQAVVSYGPCQFPTLGFVVDRYLKIQSFRPEDFWYLTLEIEAPDEDAEPASGKTKAYAFTWDRLRLYDRASCVAIFQMCIAAKEGVVTECNSKPTSKPRPVPLNTIELQKEASRHFRISSDKTMEIAEKLYQNGIISYPRTETTVYHEGFELRPLLEEQRTHGDWGQYATSLLEQNLFDWPRNGGQDDQAHPPIHPLKSVALRDLHDDERKIYDLITRHFLACCSRDARGFQSSVLIQIPTRCGGELFKSTGLMVLERNWLEVYRWTKWQGNKIPSFQEGDVLNLDSASMRLVSGKTEAPLPLSESDLITAMDQSKIGTDATIATHIKTVQDRKYVDKDRNDRFIPTKVGLVLYDGYENMGYQMMKPYLRAQMELDMARISRGELSKDAAIQSCLSTMREVFGHCIASASKLDDAVAKYFVPDAEDEDFVVLLPSISDCGTCGADMDLCRRARDPDGAQRCLRCNRCASNYFLPSRGEFSASTIHCAICHFRVVTVTNEETRKSHSICPKCYKEPPGPPFSEDGIAEFRCFSCAHPLCTLAGRIPGSEVGIAPCRVCRVGEMKLGKVAGKSVFNCSSPECKHSWWLPKAITSVTLDPTVVCEECSRGAQRSIVMLQISAAAAQLPPGCPTQGAICPVCADFWDLINEQSLRLPSNDAGREVPLRGIDGNRNGRQRDDNATTNANKATKKRGRVEVAYSADSEDFPVCDCKKKTVKKTVVKDGQNKGREFFTCDSKSCNFFKFADESQRPRIVANDGVTCSNCHKQGHFSRECPNRRSLFKI